MEPKLELGGSSSGGMKRGRGRPQKHGGGPSGSAPSAEGRRSPPPTKRGRGRPRKSGSTGGGRGGQSGPAPSVEEVLRSPSPAALGSSVAGLWEDFPISEFLLTLYQPIGRTQWLPKALGDALEGEGPFLFQLHRVGAHQGPWEVRARVVVTQEGNETHRRAEMFSGWRDFAGFYRLAPLFIIRFKLMRGRGVFYVKVYDVSLCLQTWEESDDDTVPPLAQA